MLISSSSTFEPPISPARVSTVLLGADRMVPQSTSTTITWTASPCGGNGPYQYKWLLFNGSEWDVVKNWSRANTLKWTPVFSNLRYRVAVWVRSAGSLLDDFEAATEAAFGIGEGPRPVPAASSPAAMPQGESAAVEPVSTVTLLEGPAPQAPGSPMVWTASATGGGAEREYKWFIHDGRRWLTAVPWSTINTFLWTALTPNPRYRIAVWARSAGATMDDFEACAEVEFAVPA